jgi:hypothetical protein
MKGKKWWLHRGPNFYYLYHTVLYHSPTDKRIRFVHIWATRKFKNYFKTRLKPGEYKDVTGPNGELILR